MKKVLLMFGLLAVLSSCKQREYRVTMREQAGSPQRMFSDNAPSSRELRDLKESYGHEPLANSAGGGAYFEATFDDSLPVELEGVNGWSRLEGGLGDTLFWFERPTGSRFAWPELVRRVESGILWLRIMKQWAIEEFGSERSEVIESFFEERVIPGTVDGYLRFTGAGAVMGSQRVGFGLRKPESDGELTPDEFFRLQVLVPIIIDISRESKMTPEELHMGVLMGLDGVSSQSERRKAWRKAGEEVALRFIREIDPERKELSWSEVRGWGVSLLWYAAQPVKYRELMLESPVITDSEKATLRDGGVVFPPMPFGVRVLGGRSGSSMTFELEPKAIPFLSNGRVMPTEESNQGHEQVVYRMRLSPPDEGPLFGAPPAYAFWSVPTLPVQEAIFGEVALEGMDLAVVIGWERLLEESALTRWRAAIEQGVQEGGPEPLRVVLQTIELAPPGCLSELLERPPGDSSK